MGLQKIILIACLVMLSGCGALKKTKHIDRVKQSASIEANTSVRINENIQVEDKSVRTQKTSEKSGNSVITEREIFFDDSGRVDYIKEKVTETRQREKQKENKENSDLRIQSGKGSDSSSGLKVETKVDSLKKDSQLTQPENSIYGYMGWGILIMCAVIALVIWVRIGKR